MRKSLVTKILGLACAAVVALIAGTAQAAIITNTCTSSFTAINFPGSWVASGWDTVAITTDTQPSIVVAKYATNLRVGIESTDMVPALSGDTIEFRITWSNQGGATADTVTLSDYIPSGLTYVTGSLTSSDSNCSNGSANEAAGAITYMSNGVAGTNPGPYGYGEIKFRATVD